MNKTELIEQICTRLQARYSAYQQEHFFIFLKRVNEKESAIQWLKVFPSEEAWHEFYFDTEFQRAFVGIAFENTSYRIDIHGFQIVGDWNLTTHTLEQNTLYKASYNPEEMPMMSKEEVEGYINQFKDALRNPQKRKIS